MPGKNPLRILLLVESLPNLRDLDPLFRHKNIFVSQPMNVLAARGLLVDWPLLLPHFPWLVKLFYRMRGLEVHFQAPPEGGRAERIESTTIRYLYLPRLYTEKKTRALLKELAERAVSYDLVHCHTVFDLGVAAMELKRALGLPFVVSVYGTDINWLFETGERKADPALAGATVEVLKAADAVICVSRDLEARVAGLGVEKQRIHWIPNGADTGLFSPGDKVSERRSLGWPEDCRVILYAGNIIPTKGLGELVEAVALMEREAAGLPEFVVMLAGHGGDYQKQLKAVISERGLERRFKFLGAQPHDRMPALMRACDIFCLPSWREGWPLSVVEALACGSPVVATGVGGIPEIVTSPGEGILCQARNPEALAGALAKALNTRWDEKLIAGSALRYSYDKLAGDIEGVYREVLGRAHRP
ncbi:MAG: glycosyltransferase [Gemmatimonadota bacterium]|nr:glycosyltransferase [Gemmatimonadota bacterium]